MGVGRVCPHALTDVCDPKLVLGCLSMDRTREREQGKISGNETSYGLYHSTVSLFSDADSSPPGLCSLGLEALMQPSVGIYLSSCYVYLFVHLFVCLSVSAVKGLQFVIQAFNF